MTRPGDRLRAFAGRWCCADTMMRIVQPLIADLQHEYARTAQDGRVWRSRAIHIAGWIAFSKVLAICIWRDDLAPRNWTSDDRRTVVRAVGSSLVLIVLTTALFEIPPLNNVVALSGRANIWLLLLTLVPQALAIAVTVAATLGIVYAVGGRALSRRVAAALVVLAIIGSALSFTNVGWITPAANQAFLVALGRRPDLPKGTHELTFGELSQMIETVRREPSGSSAWHFGNRTRYLKELTDQYHTRLALSSSLLVFAVFVLGMVAGGLSKRWVLAIAAVVTMLAYYLLMYAGRALLYADTIPAYVSAWAPNATIAFFAAFLILRKFRVSVSHEPAR